MARRQDALEFNVTVEMSFVPSGVGEEAGVTLFLQRGMHFDLGVIGVAANGSSAGNVSINESEGGGHKDGKVVSVIQLRTVTALSSPDGLSDPLSRPGVVQLKAGASAFILRVRALNASMYEFAFRYIDGLGYDEGMWSTVGYGMASEVSGGFTGVSAFKCIVHSCTDAVSSLSSSDRRRSWGCMRLGTGVIQLPPHTSKILSTMLFLAFSEC